MYLIAGLGNPGIKYEKTRHNIGFMVIDSIINSLNPIPTSKAQFKGELYKKGSLYFLKPQTFMNLSGESILAVKNYFKIDEIIVIHDDLDLAYGVVKFKRGGGNGGHNGLKSIDSLIGTDYVRVRLGIGKPERTSVTNFVLSGFNTKERECLENIIQKAHNATIELTKQELIKVSSLYSSKKSICIETL